MAFTTKISIGPLSTVTDYVVLRFYTAENPGVQVAITTLPPPHANSVLVSQLLDEDVSHICKIYYSVDGIVLGSLKHEFEFQPVNQTIEVEEPLELHVVDTVTNEFEILAGQDEYNNVSLAGKQFFIEQRVTGTLRDDEWDAIITGGFKLLTPKLFDVEDTYFIHFIPVIRQDSFPSPGQLLNDVRIVDADETLDDTYHKKICVAAFATTIGTTTFPPLSTLPNIKMKFVTHGGSQRYWKLQFNAGDTANFFGTAKNVIYLGKGEELELLIKAGICYVTGYSGDAKYTGQRIWGDKLELNTLLRDGSQYNQADYPRLVEWINTLPVGQVVSYATWNTSTVVDGKTIYPNKGKFAIDGVATFKVPNDLNRFIRSLKYTDATVDTERESQGPGGYQIDGVGNFSADVGMPKGYGYTGSPNTARFGNGFNNPQTINIPGLLFNTGKNETRGENTGLLPLLII